MTEPPLDDAVAGREGLPWTQAPDWVALAAVSPAAHSLYVKLRMYVNRDRGDQAVWPGAASLAALMGVSRGDKITRWLQELVNIGALDIKRTGMPRRNLYVVHLVPPDGYTGSTSLRDWYASNRPALDAGKAAAKAKRDARRAGKAQVNAVTPESGEQAAATPVAPVSGQHVAPETGQHVAPVSGREPDVENQTKKNHLLPPPPRGAAAPPEPEAVTREEEDKNPDEETPTPTQVAAEVLNELILNGVGPGKRPVGRLQVRILTGLVDLLAAGWPPERLGLTLAGSWDGATSIGAVLDARIRALAAEPVPAPAQQPDPAGSGLHTRPPCPNQECDSRLGGAGMVETESGVRPCPQCRPEQSRKFGYTGTPAMAGAR